MYEKTKKIGFQKLKENIATSLISYKISLYENKNITNQHIIDNLVDASYVYSEASLKSLLNLANSFKNILIKNKVTKNIQEIELLILFLESKINFYYEDKDLKIIKMLENELRKKLTNKNKKSLEQKIIKIITEIDQAIANKENESIIYNLLPLYLLKSKNLKEDQIISILEILEENATERESLIEIRTVRQAILNGGEVYFKNSQRKKITETYNGNMKKILTQIDYLLTNISYDKKSNSLRQTNKTYTKI